MNVQELRESEYIESVESETYHSWTDKTKWKVTPNQESYRTEDGVEFLCSLNVEWEGSDGTLWIPKGNIR